MFQPDVLKDQVIIITGGGTGLGKSMGLRFAELGANLVITSRKVDNLTAAAEDLRAKGADVLVQRCDVRKPEEVEAMVEAAMGHFGKIDGVVNNAAGNFLSPTELLSYNAFNAVVGIVLHGTFNCTLAAGRKMIESGKGGKFLNIVTTYAWTGSGFVVPSACGKAGVLAMTRSLAVEWAKYHIRLNAIAPGPFPTPGAWEQLMPPGFEDMARNKVPMKRFGKHEELANLAAYLMSDYSDYITGEVVTIDGGEWLMGGEFNSFAAMDKEEWAGIAAKMGGQG